VILRRIFSIVFSRADRASLSSFPRVGRSVGRRVHSFVLVRRGRKRPAHSRSFERERQRERETKGRGCDFSIRRTVQNPTQSESVKTKKKKKMGTDEFYSFIRKKTETNPFQPHQFQPVHVPVHVHGATFAPVQTGLPTPEERARQSAKEIRQARKQVRLAAKGKQLLQLKRKAGSEGVQSFGGEAKPTSSTYTDNQDLQVVPDVDTIGRTNNAPATSSEGHSGYLVNSQEQNKDTTTTYLAHTTSAPTTTSIMPPKKKNEDYDDGKELPAMPTGNTAEDERERKRLKRLLRNRVSAQHARERKKAYMNSLENAERERQSRLDELENRCKTLEKENEMLREVIKTYTQKDPSAK